MNREKAFIAFKCVIYLLLAYNVFAFFQEEVLASFHTFRDGVSLAGLAEAFPATIDTGSWLVLLLIFELETSVIRSEVVVGGFRWAIPLVTAICYALIVYSFWGYIAKVITLTTGFVPYAAVDLCDLVGTGAALVADLDEYAAITLQNCGAPANAEFFRMAGEPIFAEASTLVAVLRLAWVDAINAAVWLLIVIVLEADVWFEKRDLMTERKMAIGKIIKIVLYGTLFAATVYWGFLGDFIDFWDAVLWLIAFVFIEMNLFQWHEEDAHA